MKTSIEIARAIEDLHEINREPCRCLQAGHDFECLHGRMMIDAAIDALEFALGKESITGRLLSGEYKNAR